MTEPSEGLAPQGSMAEFEVPQHTADPDAAPDAPLEDTPAYELAVEDGAALPAQGPGPGDGDLAPEFRAPGD